MIAALLGCGRPVPAEVVQQAPLGDVSLRHARVRVDGALAEPPSKLGASGVAGGDIDGDGLADLAAPDDAVGVRVALLKDAPDLLEVPTERPAASVAILESGLLAVGNHLERGGLDRDPALPVVALWSVDRVQLDRVGILTHAEREPGVFDYLVTALGDVDGDEREDLAVRLANAGPEAWAGTVWVLAATDGDRELDSDAAARLLGPAAEMYAGGRLAAGDLDGDGVSDVIASLNAFGGGATAVVAPGPLSGDVVLDPEVLAPVVDVPAATIASGGDLDGDGRDDLALAGGDVVVFAGPVAGESGPDEAVAVLRRHDHPVLRLHGAAIARDLDGDGIDDLLAASTDDLGAQAGGVTAVWYGPLRGVRELSCADARLLGEHPGDRSGSAVLGPGDTDGDGFGDLVVAASDHDFGRGAVYVLSGGLR